MKIITKSPGIIFICLFCFLQGYGQKSQHVILISIDGFRPDFYLDKKWPAPNLQMLRDKGVYAKGVQSVFPSVTYPSHTTITTGAYPGKHGIYYNAPVDGKKGQWYWEEKYIRIPTLWDAVHDAGKTSGSVMWPVTVGAPIDYNFPVKRADDDDSANQLESTMPFITPAGLLDEMQQETGKLTGADFNTDNTIDVTIGRMGIYIFKKFKPALMALHFVTADHQQHAHGREGAEVHNAVALIDSMIGLVVKSIKDAGLENSSTLIITGDHGFVNSTNTFSPNVLLAQHNLLNKDGKLNFYCSGGAAFLYVKDKNDQASICRVRSLLNGLPVDQKKAFSIIERNTLDRIGANPEVVIGLAMKKGYVAINNSKGELMGTKKPGGSHGYYPDFDEIQTGFIAYGAGIGTHREIKTMGIKDVAPVITKLLGLSFVAPDGILIPGILEK